MAWRPILLVVVIGWPALAGCRPEERPLPVRPPAGGSAWEEQMDARRRMVETQIVARGVRDPRVIAAMERVPRHRFVPPGIQHEAHDDHPLPIGQGQTISQPYIVAAMTEALGVGPGARVLEVGTGSGYQAAVLARIVKEVLSVEINPGLAGRASQRLRELGFGNVQVRTGDGFFGWPEKAPFDGIIVTCAAPEVPGPLFEQLAEGRRLVIPLGPPGGVQELTVITKKKGRARVERVLDVRFVPMTGEAEKVRKR